MRIDSTDVRQMPLHIQEQVGVAIASQIALANPVAVQEEGEVNMTLQKAIKLLETEYEKATKLDFVYNPLAYALYKVWRKANGEER